MKLFVRDNKTKIYLRISAQTRGELQNKLGRRHFVVRGKKYSINDVQAETDNTNTAVGAILGGIIGAFGGPIGAITGGTLGGIVGSSSDSKEKQSVLIFNRSKA